MIISEIARAMIFSVVAKMRKPVPMPLRRGEYWKVWSSDKDGNLSVNLKFDFELMPVVGPPEHVNCRCLAIPVDAPPR